MITRSAFSIIIPTFHEVMNISRLIAKISEVDFGGREFEVILMDDNSNDGTVELVSRLQGQYPWLKIIVRKATRSLSQSIIDGYDAARYPLLVTIDADLSHPVEKIPELLAVLDDPNIDMVLGSRYVRGGGVDVKWPLHRVFVSRMSALLANILLISGIKDPLSGFVAIRKSLYTSGGKINTIGWKIGLEIMVKCHCRNIKEVPIIFNQRLSGKSKLNLKIGLDYLRQLRQLFFYKYFKLHS